MGSLSFKSETGIYCLQEILFLRNVVREGILDGYLDAQEAEAVARRVLEAYSHGVRRRSALIEIARYGAAPH